MRNKLNTLASEYFNVGIAIVKIFQNVIFRGFTVYTSLFSGHGYKLILFELELYNTVTIPSSHSAWSVPVCCPHEQRCAAYGHLREWRPSQR